MYKVLIFAMGLGIHLSDNEVLSDNISSHYC